MFYRRISYLLPVLVILFGVFIVQTGVSVVQTGVSVVQAQEGTLPPASVYGQVVKTYRVSVTGFLKETGHSNVFRVCRSVNDENNESLAYFEVQSKGDYERENEGPTIRETLDKQVIFSGKFREVIEHGKVVKIVCLAYTLKLTPWQIAKDKLEAGVKEVARQKAMRDSSVGYLDLEHLENDIWVCGYCSEGSMDQDSHEKQDRYGINSRTLFTGLDKKDLRYRAWKKVRVRAVFTNPDDRECSTIEVYPVSDDAEISLTEHK